MNQITKLSTNSLHIHPENTKFFDGIEGEQYERFKKSIKEDGVLTPLIIAPDMTIISGHQRYKACKDLGINLVPVIIREDLVDEDEKRKKLLATNFGREKNNPMKQSKVITEYEKLCEIKHGGARVHNAHLVTQDQIAKEFGISSSQLRRLKQLQDLIPELQQMIENGSMKATVGYKIWAKMPQEEQEKFFNDIGREKIKTLTQKATQQYIDKINNLERELDNEKKKEPKVVIKEIEKVIDNTDYAEINKIKQEKRELQIKCMELKSKVNNTNERELKNEINDLKSLILKKDDELKELERVRKELSEEKRLVAKFIGESTNLKLISTTSENKKKMMDFLNDMSKYDYLAETFNEIPEATRREWLKGVKGIHKWATNILSIVNKDFGSDNIVLATDFEIN